MKRADLNAAVALATTVQEMELNLSQLEGLMRNIEQIAFIQITMFDVEEKPRGAVEIATASGVYDALHDVKRTARRELDALKRKLKTAYNVED